MNCFEWQKRSSDYLDSALTGALKKEADDHLAQCDSCQERHKRYRIILSSISGQPRSALPATVRASPFSANLPRMDGTNRKTRWQRAPWFVRTSVEGLGITVIILFVVAMVPRMRELYEKSMERRLDAFGIPESSSENADSTKSASGNAPLARGHLRETVDGIDATSSSEEFSSESDDTHSDDVHEDEIPEIHVGNSEVWRFNLKTDSPHEIRPRITRTLIELQVPADTPGLGGVEAPGGIQFDLLVPKSVIPALKAHLQRMIGGNGSSGTASEPSRGSTSATMNGLSRDGVRSHMHVAGAEAFTWYKIKSKRRIPAGMSRVVIWLSQM